MGFTATRMSWVYDKYSESDVQIEEPKASSGGRRKNGMRTLKLKYIKHGKASSHNFTQKSPQFVR
jgi:hypothetical protein